MATTDFKDYYTVLGIDRQATAEQIKTAYRRLARKYHPDINRDNPDAEVRFKEINEAYEVLSDPDKRRRYDQYGRAWNQVDESRVPPGAGDFDAGRYGSFDSILEELLGGLGGRRGGGRARTEARTPHRDLEATLTLDLADALRGGQKRLTIDGESLNVRIPPGVRTGTRLRLRGQGERSPYSSERGDLYLTIELAPHPQFVLEGDDLLLELPIAPDEAVLGAQVSVPTLEGQIALTVPPGVRSGQTLRLRGKGWPRAGEGRGDLRVKLQVVTPRQPTDTERALYEQLRRERTWDPRAGLVS